MWFDLIVDKIVFNRSERPTLGVEWEVALVDASTRDLSNTADDVFRTIEASVGPDGHRLHRELLRNTMELVTDICPDVPAAMADIRESLDLVLDACDANGVRLFGAGTHPFSEWSAQQVTSTPHYDELIERTRWWGRQMLIWGVHVHVGVSHEAKVMPIINSLLLQYPHLLALSASSPMWAGLDTGYASNRALLFQQLPTAGLPYQFADWEQWCSFVRDQIKSGVIEQVGGMHWDIRPAPRWGTIEVRICDSTSDLDELASLVALTHCLIVDLDRRLEAGEDLPTLPPWHVRENKWRAARYGLEAEIILNRATDERLVVDDLTDVVERLMPVARDLGCARELAAVLDIPVRGASYQRQRAVAAANDGDQRAVVDALVEEVRASR